jgi:polyvinyl alcohol dehydrogenase (cytochrome)
MKLTSRLAGLLFVFVLGGFAQAEPGDWPMYNQSVEGWRHNAAETTLNAGNVPGLVETWRFPAKDSDQVVGVIHATPAVVDGCAYFGTATEATFYKLSPEGKLLWSYRNPDYQPIVAEETPATGDVTQKLKFRSSEQAIMTSALVTDDTVYFGDLGGWIYALDRESGKERWKLSTRAAPFPGAHPLNWIFASPILADGKIILGGGALEQLIAGNAFYRGSNGRGFIVALNPADGAVVWKYDVGPKPEKLDPPIVIKDSWGDHAFYFGPATSSVWSAPSFDEESGTIFFGTDVNTAPRRPTEDDPSMATRDSCAVIAVDVKTGTERWVTQINPGDVWTNSMRSYSPEEQRYKDQSIGDTPKILTIDVEGAATKVVGAGCKNGGFYLFRASDGKLIDHTPLYLGPPSYPLTPAPDARVLALPSAIGGLQTGCATDGHLIFTNGIDAVRLASQETAAASAAPPTGGRVVALSTDLKSERWRHERPTVAEIGGPVPSPIYKNVGDPVASGVASANGVVYFTAVASGKFIALDATSGAVLKEIDVGPVWSGPAVSRGHVYVGTGNTLFSTGDYESYFPKRYTGTLHCFGLPNTSP